MAAFEAMRRAHYADAYSKFQAADIDQCAYAVALGLADMRPGDRLPDGSLVTAVRQAIAADSPGSPLPSRNDPRVRRAVRELHHSGFVWIHSGGRTDGLPAYRRWPPTSRSGFVATSPKPPAFWTPDTHPKPRESTRRTTAEPPANSNSCWTTTAAHPRHNLTWCPSGKGHFTAPPEADLPADNLAANRVVGAESRNGIGKDHDRDIPVIPPTRRPDPIPIRPSGPTHSPNLCESESLFIESVALHPLPSSDPSPTFSSCPSRMSRLSNP